MTWYQIAGSVGRSLASFSRRVEKHVDHTMAAVRKGVVGIIGEAEDIIIGSTNRAFSIDWIDPDPKHMVDFGDSDPRDFAFETILNILETIDDGISDVKLFFDQFGEALNTVLVRMEDFNIAEFGQFFWEYTDQNIDMILERYGFSSIYWSENFSVEGSDEVEVTGLLRHFILWCQENLDIKARLPFSGLDLEEILGSGSIMVPTNITIKLFGRNVHSLSLEWVSAIIAYTPLVLLFYPARDYEVEWLANYATTSDDFPRTPTLGELIIDSSIIVNITRLLTATAVLGGSSKRVRDLSIDAIHLFADVTWQGFSAYRAFLKAAQDQLLYDAMMETIEEGNDGIDVLITGIDDIIAEVDENEDKIDVVDDVCDEILKKTHPRFGMA